MSNQEMCDVEHESTSSDTNPYHTLIKFENIITESRYVNGSLKFSPPMYIQRYEAVSLILKQLPWNDSIKKAVDFGCAELGFFLHLKCIPSMREILEVDVDEDVLLRCATRAAPLNVDYLFSKRSTPLNVYLLAGSIGEYDDQLQGTDVVVGIEVLEHLNREVLDKVPQNVFHDIKPRIAIFTTPNADFNVLFTNVGRFRHPDHKFEWTRMEFVRWTQEVIAMYPDYSVKLYEIGVGPEDTGHLGCCTQMAVFERKPEFEEEFDSINLKRGINNYKLIREYIYPFYVDQRSNELKIFHEVEYRLKFTFHVNKFFNSEEELFEIPLEDIYPFVSDWCDSEEALRLVLLEHGFYVLEREGMQYLSYRGYLSDSSDTEENESMEMSVVENLEHENWDWNCDETNSNTEPGKDDELLDICTEGACLEGTEMENGGMDSQFHEVVQERNMKEFVSSVNLSFNSCDSAMAVDQEMETKSRSMSWSAIPQKKDIELDSRKTTLVRFSSLPVASFIGSDRNVYLLRKCCSLDSFLNQSDHPQ